MTTNQFTATELRAEYKRLKAEYCELYNAGRYEMAERVNKELIDIYNLLLELDD